VNNPVEILGEIQANMAAQDCSAVDLHRTASKRGIVHLTTGASPRVIHNCGNQSAPRPHNAQSVRAASGPTDELQPCKLPTMWITPVDNFWIPLRLPGKWILTRADPAQARPAQAGLTQKTPVSAGTPGLAWLVGLLGWLIRSIDRRGQPAVTRSQLTTRRRATMAARPAACTRPRRGPRGA
jgi:hypothetical protein